MRATLVVHIIVGGLGLLFGTIALSAQKGAPLHRKSGMLFVYVMLPMAATGLAMAIFRGVATAVNIPAATMTAYLVVTALTTVRPPAVGARALAIGGMLIAVVVGMVSLNFGFEAIANGGTRKGMPAPAFIMFGLVGILGGAGDWRVLRSGALRGAQRLTRHLWRMCFALFIAALSFFLGQAQVFPEPIRIIPLLALPVLAVLVSLGYWLWRVRFRQRLRGFVLAAGTGGYGRGASIDERSAA